MRLAEARTAPTTSTTMSSTTTRASGNVSWKRPGPGDAGRADGAQRVAVEGGGEVAAVLPVALRGTVVLLGLRGIVAEQQRGVLLLGDALELRGGLGGRLGVCLPAPRRVIEVVLGVDGVAADDH